MAWDTEGGTEAALCGSSACARGLAVWAQQGALAGVLAGMETEG